MIKVNFDMSLATDEEKEAFLTLPHVAGAIDTMAQLKTNEVKLSLVVDNGRPEIPIVPETAHRRP